MENTLTDRVDQLDARESQPEHVEMQVIYQSTPLKNINRGS
jgi:hypothetical protein